MINKESGADCGQSPVGGVEEGIGGLVVLRAYPLALDLANFRGGQSLRFQEYGQTPHPETVFLPQTVPSFEFQPLDFG